MQLEGVYSVLPTPFHPNGDIDEASLRRVVDLFIAAGVNGVTALGVTGEVARLDEGERRRVLDVVVEQVNGRIGVVAGTTAEGTRTCIGYSRQAHASGATAVMVSPPRMPKLNSDAVLRHFAALASAVDIEIVVQDYPPACGFAMEPALLARIAREIPRARHDQARRSADAVQDLSDRRVVRRNTGPDFRRPWRRVSPRGTARWSHRRDDRVCVPGDSRFCRVALSCRAGHEAADTFYRAVPLLRFEFQEGIGTAIRKEVLRRRGALAHAAMRPPAGALDQATREALDRVMQWSESLLEGRPSHVEDAETIGRGRHCQLRIGARRWESLHRTGGTWPPGRVSSCNRGEPKRWIFI